MFDDIWWHGSQTPIEKFVFNDRRGGVHLGSKTQALSFGPHLYGFKLTRDTRLQTSKDTGEEWGRRAKRAKSKKDGFSYLNRFEGVEPCVFDDVSDSQRDKLDTMSDAQFLKLIPGAHKSLLIFTPYCLMCQTHRVTSNDHTLTITSPKQPSNLLSLKNTLD